MKRATNPPRTRAESPAQWLDELAAALHLPFERSEAIREELAGHLRERIRDLQLEGLNEPDATVVAVKELGDAAAGASTAPRTHEASRGMLRGCTTWLSTRWSSSPPRRGSCRSC